MNIDHLVVATHNKGKFTEIADLLSSYVDKFSSASDFDLAEPEETGETFEENARLKAMAAAKETGLPALADDSGLCVDRLHGAPGVYSARWAGPDRDFRLAMEKVNDLLEDSENRAAAFHCVMALAFPEGEIKTFEGKIDGNLSWPPRGKKGFGYDPMFVPNGENETFGEMPPEKKRSMSHRTRAFQKLVENYFKVG